MSLRTKLLLLIVAVLVPAVVAFAIVSETAQSRADDDIRDEHRAEGEAQIRRLEGVLAAYAQQAEAISQSPELLSELAVRGAPGAPRELDDLALSTLTSARNVDPGVRSLSIIGPEGILWASTEPRPFLSGAVLPLSTTGTTFGPARELDDSDQRLMVLAPTVLEGGVLIHFAIESDLDALLSITDAHRGSADTRETLLAQRSSAGGTELITDRRFGTESDSPALSEPDPLLEAAFSAEVPTIVEMPDYRGVDTLAMVTTLQPTGWAAVVKVDSAEAFGPVSEVPTALLVPLVIAGVAILAVVAVAARSMARRLRRLRVATDAVRLNEPLAPLNDPSRDEIGLLSDAVDQLSADRARDAAQNRSTKALLEFHSRRDVVTGLPNRAAFMELLAAELGHADAIGPGPALALIDLDGFRFVNDEYGQSEGDELLKAVAERFGATLPLDGLLARIGADEFAVMVPSPIEVDQAIAMGQDLIDSLAAPIALSDHELFLGASVGVALADPDTTLDSLTRDADAAKHRAKELGGNRVEAATSVVDTEPRRLAESSALRRGIDEGQLCLYFQPIVDLDDGRLVGVEALVRWRHPTLGLRNAGDFLRLARASGLTSVIDRWVIADAMRQMADWENRFRLDSDFFCSVNITPNVLSEPGLADHVAENLRIRNLDPARIQLEITEDGMGADPDAVHAAVRELRSLGVSLAIDDFGTRSSNFDRLRELEVDAVKIDRSFVQDLDTDGGHQQIAAHVVSLADALHLRVIAEGIEGAEQRRILREAGCGFGQGFHFAQALNTADIERYLAAASSDQPIRLPEIDPT